MTDFPPCAANEEWVLNPLLVLAASPTELGFDESIVSCDGSSPLHIRSPLLIQAISCLGGVFTQAEAIQSLASATSVTNEQFQLWAFLVNEGIIIRRHQPSSSGDALLEHWTTAGWGDGALFHNATRDFPFMNMALPKSHSADNRLMRHYASVSSPPSPYHPGYQSDSQISLNRTESLTMGDDPLWNACPELNRLSIILDFAFGERVHFKEEFIEEDDFYRMEMIKKAVPSGGGRHPTEAYVVLGRPWGDLAGSYHYSVRDHALIPLPDTGAADPELFNDVSIFLASRLERAMWRYRDSRSARAIFFDVGHAMAMAEQVALRMGWSSEPFVFPTSDRFPSPLGLLPVSEPIIGGLCLARAQLST